MSTHIDVLGTARHTAGSAGSKGGQFANKSNTAPLGELTEDLSLDTPKRSSELTTEAIRQSQQILERTARQITRSFRIDPTNAEDIVQDSWVHLYERDGRHDDIAQRASERAFLNLTARKFANDYGNDARFGLRTEDFAGRRQLRARAEAFTAEHGRKMTPNEYEEAAHEIRMSFKAGARPKPDYFREISQLSLDVRVYGDADITLGDTLEEATEAGFDGQEDEAAIALHALDNADATKDDVRKQMWRIMSVRVDGAPQPVADSIDPKTVTNYRRLVNKAGGAHKLGMAWLDGELTPELDAALFAPFGDVDDKQRQLVVDVLDSNPKFADRIWTSGLSAASR